MFIQAVICAQQKVHVMIHVHEALLPGMQRCKGCFGAQAGNSAHGFCRSAKPVDVSFAGRRGTALEVVMNIWIERQLEFVGSYRTNLATTALVQLLTSRHPALMALQVKLNLLLA